MILALLAVLSLGQAAAIDVPFVAQTDALCGGASVAMVLRYWGNLHADAEQFAALVEHRSGGVSGIADTVLANAVRVRGWRTETVNRSAASLQSRLAASQPVVVLLSDRGTRYHYVVVVGVAADGFVVHDPSWGPSRVIRASEFARRWNASGRWSLVILPADSERARPSEGARGFSRAPGPSEGARGFSQASDAPSDGARGFSRASDAPSDGARGFSRASDAPSDGARGFSRASDAPSDGARGFSRASNDACETDLADALADLARSGLDHADDLLAPVRDRCPNASGPLRELAAARFAARRWEEAAGFARRAIDRDRGDEYAHLVLGASLFMLDDQPGALRAWNEIGQPLLNQVHVEGIRRLRYQTVTDTLGLRPNSLLTADAFLRARHRLDELPDRATARLALKPEDDGFASIDVVIAEQPGLPRGRAEWIATGVRVGIDREVAVRVPGASGEGEMWSASWRWWSNRPKVAVGFAAPRVAGLSGVWRADGSWETESYTTGGPELRSETRAHGGLTVSDWLTGGVRYSLSGGVDAWGGLRAASIGATLERRWMDDRLAVSGSATRWIPVIGGDGVSQFNALGARVAARSRPVLRGWRYLAAAGLDRVSDDAPLTLWPGAGEGWARTPMLRAHPLLDDGAIDVSGRSAFGRTIGYANLEAQRWFERPAIVRLGVAGFVDVAQARRQLDGGSEPVQSDAGAGLRLRLPGDSRILRIDFAHGLRDGANALSVGWVF